MYVDPKLYAAEELANAIIIKAVEDYRKAMKDLWLCPRSVNVLHTIVECESCFRSPYGISGKKSNKVRFVRQGRRQITEKLSKKTSALSCGGLWTRLDFSGIIITEKS